MATATNPSCARSPFSTISKTPRVIASMLLLPSSPPLILFSLFLLTLTIISFRLLSILPSQNPPTPARRKRGSPTHLLILLGSGGHTAEMLALLKGLDTVSYNHRTWVISEGDAFSAGKAAEFEKGLADTAKRKKNKSKGNEEDIAMEPQVTIEITPSTYSIKQIPRARHIHQPLSTTPFSSLRCLISCIHLLLCYSTSSISSSTRRSYPPDLILTNGPGTAVILILASHIVRLLFFLFFTVSPILTTTIPHFTTTTTHHDEKDGGGGGGGGDNGSQDSRGRRRGEMRTIYIESWARVKRLSLTGRILVALRMCDRVLVQWEGLAQGNGNGNGNGNGKVEFRGMLVR